MEDGTNMPIATSIIDSTNYEELSPIEIANRMFTSLGRILMNPLYIQDITSATSIPVLEPTSSVAVNYDAQSNFNGYKIKLKQNTSSTSVLPNFPAETPNTEGLISEFTDSAFTWDNGDTTITCTDALSTRGCCALLADKPVDMTLDPASTVKMSFEVDFQMAASGNSRWCIGLCRKNDQQHRVSGEFMCTSPPYYDINAGKGQTNVGWGYSKQYYDFVVCRVGTFLRVFQSCVDTDRQPRSAEKSPHNLVMREVNYYHANNAYFKGGVPYDIGANGDAYDSVAFKVCGERVSCYMVKGGSYYPLVDLTTMSASTKTQLFTPVSDLQRTLYGKVYLKRNTDLLEITERHVYSHIDSWDCTNPYAQLSTQLILTDQYDRWGKLLENRDWNNMNATLTANYAYQTVNAGAGMQNYNMCLLTAESQSYLPAYTQQLSAGRLLGFEGRFLENAPTLDPAAPDMKSYEFNSIARPDLISPKSLFVRLNNFTHNTAVGTKGNAYSKILMHLPRFDNSGAEIGALYFEPYERLYVALNNPEELFINSFDLDLVYDNEQYAECIVGKTIICLHIRPRGIKILDSQVKKNVLNEIKEIVIRD